MSVTVFVIEIEISIPEGHLTVLFVKGTNLGKREFQVLWCT